MQYKSLKYFNTNDWGKMALTGLLAGVIATTPYVQSELLKALLDFISLLGLICLIVWIYRKVKKIP